MNWDLKGTSDSELKTEQELIKSRTNSLNDQQGKKIDSLKLRNFKNEKQKFKDI